MPSETRRKIDLTPVKAKKLPIFFIVGGPGSGKGTQCEKIVAKFGFTHISSGDLLRAEVKSGSSRGKEMAKIMEAGQLAPLEFILDLIKETMLEATKKGSKGFLIDGYPREVKQGDQFEAEIMPSNLVIYFDVPDDVLIKRLLKRAEISKRADDNLETIKKRLGVFHGTTAPVITHYQGKGKLVKIDAKGIVDEIFAQVSTHITTTLSKI
ncbi:hypothetical protein L596_019880 [Steinernema carpocapsae]|uniref:adenylate kinase n=1 Tax=Steinernema carpocapsae TaxID=34508 RepID=A0A4U5MS12_STECR|nr:hypothetical protein L596_019880 [Steinernema carpocapsae]